VIGAEKWESVTWDWVEREIVECLLIANDRPEKPSRISLAGLLAGRFGVTKPSPKSAATQRRSTCNG
jgi:hypothetical protein